MTSHRNGRILPRFLAGTVLAGSLAFAAQVEAQQSGGQNQGQRADRGAEQRGPGGRGRGEGRDPAQMVERRVSMLTERLSLSATQAVSIREILLDEHTQLETFRPAKTPGQTGQRPDSAARAQRTRPDSAARAQGRAQMEALRERTNARIESVLTAEQRTTWRETVAARGSRPEGGPGRGGRGRGPGGQGGTGRGGQQTPPPAV